MEGRKLGVGNMNIHGISLWEAQSDWVDNVARNRTQKLQ